MGEDQVSLLMNYMMELKDSVADLGVKVGKFDARLDSIVILSAKGDDVQLACRAHCDATRAELWDFINKLAGIVNKLVGANQATTAHKALLFKALPGWLHIALDVALIVGAYVVGRYLS